MSKKITIMGAGCWGAAIGFILSENGHQVSFWDKIPEAILNLKNNYSSKILKNAVDQRDLHYFYDLEPAVRGAEIIITAIPAQTYAGFWKELKPFLKPDTKIINCSKGIDVQNTKFIFQLFLESMPDFPFEHYLTLSGPSYASEVINRIPTAVVVAGKDPLINSSIQKIFCNSWFRVYTNTDLLGVELAGAVKNVIAIASGITDGIGYGVNTCAALITRGNAEIIRLGIALGAKIETFYGLAGIGDLMLTSMSNKSRNYSYGYYIGQGLSIEQAKSRINTVVEGIETVKSTKKLAENHHIEMPIVQKIFDVLFNKRNPLEAVRELMERNLKSEN